MIAYMTVIYTIIGIYMILNFKYDLQMFQQNSYRTDRYWRWLRGNMFGAWRMVDTALLLLMLSTLLFYPLSSLIVALTALVKSFLIFKKKYKKPLVFTRRVWRLYSVTGVIAAGLSLAACLLFWPPGTIYWGSYSGAAIAISVMLLLCIFSWAPMLVASWILIPVERLISQHYVNDAKRILRSMPDLTVVGITGSYGKTSTKHYLTRILSESFDVLMTPGSYNTPMGVVRTIREMMKPYNSIFVCEMGAKQVGDIKEICDIVHPKYGIVTAVGPMHLESFKSIENVCRTKFELVDALPSDGIAIINNDFAPCAERPVSNTGMLRYGITTESDCDYKAVDIHYTGSGTSFAVVGPEGYRLELSTRLLGECNISDLLAAVIVAIRLGVPDEKIRYAVSSISQVEHRLSIKQTPGGVTIIDDAFNSNPSGSKMAVDVLEHFTGGKRIIVTPGMIELGDRQEELNREFGEYIGHHVDVAIVVGHYNREAICEGIRSTDFDSANLYEAESFNDAQRILSGMLQSGDTILYENDLPDTFK